MRAHTRIGDDGLAMPLSRLLSRTKPEALLLEHGPHVRGLLYRLFGADADIDDVFQNVFVQVFSSLPTFAGRAKLKTWVHRVALNVAYQEMRRRYQQRRGATENLDDGDHGARSDRDVHADVERKEAARRVHAALERLPPKQRLAVALHDLQGMTLREIADDTGLPLQTVATQVRAGRVRLAQALADLRAGAPLGPERRAADDDDDDDEALA